MVQLGWEGGAPPSQTHQTDGEAISRKQPDLRKMKGIRGSRMRLEHASANSSVRAVVKNEMKTTWSQQRRGDAAGAREREGGPPCRALPQLCPPASHQMLSSGNPPLPQPKHCGQRFSLTADTIPAALRHTDQACSNLNVSCGTGSRSCFCCNRTSHPEFPETQ